MQTEIRSLQAVGGLPELWRESEPLNCTGYGEMLYIDPDTRMWSPYQSLLTESISQ